MNPSPTTPNRTESLLIRSWQWSLSSGGWFSIRDLRIDADTRYHWRVKAVFVELPPFERHREDYLDDEAFLRLQRSLMLNPEAGDVVPGTGGLRKPAFRG